MTHIFRSGQGIDFDEKTEWHNGDEVSVTEVSISRSMFGDGIQPWNLASTYCEPGRVLTIDEFGNLEWKTPFNPFEGDLELQEKYPAVKDAWHTLLAAVNEYEVAKKLAKDYDDQGQ